MKWTKEITNTSGNFKNSSFLCSKEHFPKLLKSMPPFLRGATQNLGISNFFINKEIAFQKFEFLKKFKDSRILIVGAGPSANEYDFNQGEYDYIWSCNYFYKNEKIKNLNVSLVTLGNENDLFDDDLLEYLNNNDTLICFENKYTKMHEMKKYKNMFKDRVFWAFTRYHSRIGSVPKLACLACFLGAKQIDFIGMDGYYSKELHKVNLNAFRPNIKPSGTIEDTIKNEEQKMKLYLDQYLVFWDYIMHDVGKEVLFSNLGHGHPCNNSTKVLTKKLGNNYHKYLSEIREKT